MIRIGILPFLIILAAGWLLLVLSLKLMKVLEVFFVGAVLLVFVGASISIGNDKKISN
jgi:hypothetical protein